MVAKAGIQEKEALASGYTSGFPFPDQARGKLRGNDVLLSIPENFFD